jgi:hypothetical protein
MPLLMAYAVDGKFKIDRLATARFVFDFRGEVISFELLYERPSTMRLVTLTHGERYNWESSPDHVLLPLKVTFDDHLIEWTLANGMSGAVEPEDGDNQEEFDEVWNILQSNFSYLRERALRQQPVVIYPNGLPTDAYLNVIDELLEDPFRAEDYEEYLNDQTTN